MLNISSIKKGIVIDHIRAGLGVEIFKLLELDQKDFMVALIINADSKKYGKKDLIKIENQIDLDLTALGILDENLTINIIEDEKITKKIELSLPETIEGIFECKNPRCITTQERDIPHKFELIDKENRIYKCIYCDHLLNKEE